MCKQKKRFLLIALNIEGISNTHVQLNRKYFLIMLCLTWQVYFSDAVVVVIVW